MIAPFNSKSTGNLIGCLILLFCNQAIAQTDSIGMVKKWSDSTIYMPLFDQPEITLDSSQLNFFRTIIEIDKLTIEHWLDKLEEQGPASMFIPHSATDRILKNLFLESQTHDATSIITFLTERLGELSNLHNQLLDAQWNIMLQLYPFDDNEPDSIKVGFVNAVDMFARTMKVYLFEATPKSNDSTIIQFNGEYLKDDHNQIRLYTSYLNQIQEFINDHSNKTNLNKILSDLSMLEPKNEVSFINDLNRVSNEFYKNFDSLFHAFVVNQPNFVEVVPGIDGLSRTEVFEAIRQQFFAYRSFVKELTHVRPKISTNNDTLWSVSLEDNELTNHFENLKGSLKFTDALDQFRKYANESLYSPSNLADNFTQRFFSRRINEYIKTQHFAIGKDSYWLDSLRAQVRHLGLVLHDYRVVAETVEIFEYNSGKDTIQIHFSPNAFKVRVDSSIMHYSIHPIIKFTWMRDTLGWSTTLLQLDSLNGSFDMFQEELISADQKMELVVSRIDDIQKRLGELLHFELLEDLPIHLIFPGYSDLPTSLEAVSVPLTEIIDLIVQGKISGDFKTSLEEYYKQLLFKKQTELLSQINEELKQRFDFWNDSIQRGLQISTDQIDVSVNRKSAILKINVSSSDFPWFSGICKIRLSSVTDSDNNPMELEFQAEFSDIFSEFESLNPSIIIIDPPTLTEGSIRTRVRVNLPGNGIYSIGELSVLITDLEKNYSFIKSSDLKQLTIGGVDFKVNEIKLDRSNFALELVVQDSDFLPFPGYQEYASDTVLVKINGENINVDLKKGRHQMIDHINTYLKNKGFDSTEIAGLRFSNKGILVLNESENWMKIGNFLEVLYQEEVKTIHEAIDKFITGQLDSISMSNEFVDISVKKDSLRFSVKVFSDSEHLFMVVRSSADLEWIMNETYLREIKGQINDLIVELDEEIEILDLNKYDHEKKKFEIIAKIGESTLSIWINLKGELSIDKDDVIKLLARVSGVPSLNDIQNDVNEWLLGELSTIQPKYLTFEINSSKAVNALGEFSINVIVKDFLSDETQSILFKLEDIAIKKDDTGSINPDLSATELTTTKILIEKINALYGDNFVVHNILYQPQGKKVGSLVLIGDMTVPVLDIKKRIEIELNLSNFNTTANFAFTKKEIAQLMFESLVSRYSKTIENTSVGLSDFRITIQSLDSENGSLGIQTHLKIPGLDAPLNYRLIVNQNFDVTTEPEDIGKLIAEGSLDKLKSLAFKELKELFSQISEYIEIDTIIAINKNYEDLGLTIPVGIRVQAKARIHNLFQVGLPPVVITADGIDVEGPKEISFTYSTPIPLPPSPFLLKDIGGSLSETQLEGHMKFVAIDENVAYVDGGFIIALKGDKKIELFGDLIVLNSLNLASSDTELNLDSKIFKSQVKTSKILKPVCDFDLKIDFNYAGANWSFIGDGSFEVFDGLLTSKADIDINKNGFDATVHTGESDVPLFSPEMKGTFRAGPNLSNPTLSTRQGVSVNGHSLGGVEAKFGPKIAGIKFDFLGVEFATSVPSYKDLDDKLIWELIKDLFKIDLKDLDKALEALLSGDININPFSDFGKGDDGISSNGNSNDRGGDNPEQPAQPYQNGNQSGQPASVSGQPQGVMGYGQFVYAVAQKDFEEKYFGSRDKVIVNEETGEVRIKIGNPKKGVPMGSIKTLDPVLGGFLPGFKKNGDNNNLYDAYRLYATKEHEEDIDGININTKIKSKKRTDGFYEFKSEVTMLGSGAGSLIYIYGDSLYMHTKDQKSGFRIPLSYLNWTDYHKNMNQFIKSDKFKKMKCVLSTLLKYSLKDTLKYELFPKALNGDDKNSIFFVKIKDTIIDYNPVPMGVWDNRCIIYVNNSDCEFNGPMGDISTQILDSIQNLKNDFNPITNKNLCQCDE